LKRNFFTNKTFRKIIATILPQVYDKIPETLPSWLREKYSLISRKEAIRNMHLPQNMQMLDKAIARLKFEELFFVQLKIQQRRFIRKEKDKGFVFERVGDLFNEFYKSYLPFELTNAQKRVIKEIRADVKSGKQMNRLLQGDVGSGKTLVALMSMLLALDNGFQAAMMVPTEVLAQQHFLSIKQMLGDLPVNVELLTGSTTQKNKKDIKKRLEKGSIDIVIGTHALIEDDVIFKNLGFVVIDEQHRFGVAQRAKMWEKNKLPPHILVMTATPIPRTLAMTLYGDLDVSVIDEMPPGRKPVKTYHVKAGERYKVYNFIKKEIDKGRQAYMVFPLIEESKTLDYENLIKGYNDVVAFFPPPKYYVAMVHGKMTSKEKEEEMRLFANGTAKIMVATTVIEVGVNVPNATIMVIESAEKFGLAQLHQLRGRVGRGEHQSYCFLITKNKISDTSAKRMSIMVNSNDGFEIAEADLRLRGPGDIEGKQQSGMPIDLKVAELGKDGKLLEFVRKVAIDILEQDVHLTNPENKILQEQLKKISFREVDWSKIS
jgi:ATP-dependent DNA helicase RecG